MYLIFTKSIKSGFVFYTNIFLNFFVSDLKMGIRPYLPIPRKSLFRSKQLPGPYNHLFDYFGFPVEGIISQLPKHYLDQIKPCQPPNRNWKVPNYPYHFIPKGANKAPIEKKYKQAMWAPIPVLYPKRSREELWSGEGMIFGFRQRDRYDQPHRTIWHPKLEHWTLYSEILDETFVTIVSDTTLDLIDECQGFDNFILKTSAQELMSDLAMRIKGRLLVSLAKQDYWENDAKMKQKIREKYKEFRIPLEEAEWVGLTPQDAVFKLQISQLPDYRPLKEVFADEEKKLPEIPSLLKNSDTSNVDKPSFGSKIRRFFRSS